MQIRNVARNFLFSIALVLVAPVSGYAANVVADGKEWRQVTETVNTSWNTLAAACDTGTGLCGGAYDGWTWASQADVRSLFQSFIGPSFTNQIQELNSVWAPLFFASFTPINSFTETDEIHGLTRDPAPIAGYAPFAGLIDYKIPGETDRATLLLTTTQDVANLGIGAWMYTTAAPIPEPEIYAMMGVGLGLLGWVGRRRKQQAA